MDKEKKKYEYHYEQDKDLEKYMAMSWGSPNGLLTITFAIAILLISTGVFLVLLHFADIIK